MKKYLIIILTLICLLTLTACNKSVNELITESTVTFKVEGDFDKNDNLVVSKNDENDLISKVKEEKEVKSDKFFYYNLKVVNNEEEKEITTSVVVTIGLEDPSILTYAGYSYKNNELKELEITKGTNNIKFTTQGLGEFVIYAVSEGENELLDGQVTKEEWNNFFENGTSNYTLTMEGKSVLSAKGNSLTSTTNQKVEFANTKIKTTKAESSYTIYDKKIYLNYYSQENFDGVIDRNNKNYGNALINDDVYTWKTSNKEDTTEYFEYFDSNEFLYMYVNKNNETYKNLKFIDAFENPFDMFKDKYDLLTWVDDHYEYPTSNFGAMEVDESYPIERRDVLELYFTDKKLTKIVNDSYIKSDIENTELSYYTKSIIEYGNASVELPQTVECKHDDTLLEFTTGKYHYKECYKCRGVVEYELHDFNQVTGKCKDCEFSLTDEINLEIDCPHMKVTIEVNKINNVAENLSVKCDFERSYEGNVEHCICEECNFEIRLTYIYDENYFEEIPCSKSRYEICEFFKDGVKVKEPITVVYYTEYAHDCEILKIEIEDGIKYAYIKCNNCQDEGKAKLEYSYSYGDVDCFRLVCRDLNNYRMYDVELPHTFANGKCIYCETSEQND